MLFLKLLFHLKETIFKFPRILLLRFQEKLFLVVLEKLVFYGQFVLELRVCLEERLVLFSELHQLCELRLDLHDSLWVVVVGNVVCA